MIVHYAAIDDREQRQSAAETLLFFLLAGAAMLFATFTAAYLIRRAGPDWTPVPLPTAAFIAAGLLVLSSVTLHVKRLKVTIALGVLFAVVQAIAFRQLAQAGVYLATSPHGSFFIMLTGVHAVHVLGGLLALCAAAAGRARVGLVAAWWHFVGGLWIYVLFMLKAL